MPVDRGCEFVGTCRQDQHIDRFVVSYDLQIISDFYLLFFMLPVIFRTILIPDSHDRPKCAEGGQHDHPQCIFVIQLSIGVSTIFRNQIISRQKYASAISRHNKYRVKAG